MDQVYGFPDRHLLKIGIRSGYFAVVSRVPCARVLCCGARQEAGDSSINDVSLTNYGREVF